MIETRHYTNETTRIVTISCSICGAEKGVDFGSMADHLELEHSPEEVTAP